MIAPTLLERLGLLKRRVHLFGLRAVSADGVTARWTRDGRPLPEDPITAGELLELRVELDERHEVADDAPVRLDVWEEDLLVLTGLDDAVVSLAGPGAAPPPQGGPVEERELNVVDLMAAGGPAAAASEALDGAVARFRHEHPADVERTILLLRDRPATGLARTHVVTWWRARAVPDPDGDSEFTVVASVGTAAGVVEHGTPRAAAVVPAPTGVAVRLSATLVDVDPADAARPEPLPGVSVRAGSATDRSGVDGAIVLDARLPVGEHSVAIARPGVDPLVLTASVTADGGGRITVAVRDPAGTVLATATTPEPSTQTTVLPLALSDPVRLRVHKLRGTVTWPDSRDEKATYAGTPLPGRHVLVLPLPEGPVAPRRPTTSKGWAALRATPGVLSSHRPGGAGLDEATGPDGAFEVRFVDLSVGARHLVWVEGTDPGAQALPPVPEVVVRTLHLHLRSLEQLNQVDASNVVDVGRHLVDHTWNLSGADAVRWMGDSLRVVNWQPDPSAPDPARNDPRVVRPDPRKRADADAPEVGGKMAVEQVKYDPALRVAKELVLGVLPLVPIDEPPDRQAPYAREAAATLDAGFAGEHFRDRVRWVLDTRRVPRAVLAATPPKTPAWIAPWDPDPATSPWAQHRLCELLEQTFVVAPEIGKRELAPAKAKMPPTDAAHARWWVDAVSLADHAPIAVPAVPDQALGNAALDAALARSVADERRLRAWAVPVSAPLVPRRTALTALRHILLAPGHGFYPKTWNDTAPVGWLSERSTGWLENAGEDENDGLIAAVAARCLDRHGLVVSTSREIRDLQAPGVVQPVPPPLNSAFAPVVDPGFLRLWQQNPIYYLGRRDVRVGGVPVYGPPFTAAGRDRRNDGPRIRVVHAAALAVDPVRRLDLYVGVHTNGALPPAGQVWAVGRTSRGTHAMYLDVDDGTGREVNPGQRFGGHLVDEVVDRCGTKRMDRGRPVPGVRSVRDNNEANFELRTTFPHWEENTPATQALRRRRATQPSAGNWSQPSVRHPSDQPPAPVFPRAVPVALLEVGFHNNQEEAKLLASSWFRRLAGEAVALGCARQLADDPTPLLRSELRRMLAEVFGAGSAVRDLAGEPDGALAAGDLARYVTTVTGVTGLPAVVGTGLGAAAETIDAARGRLTRASFVNLLTRVLAGRAGYTTGDPQIATAVTGTILGGLPTVPRPDEPVTRGEAGAFVALALGLAPATLATVAATPKGPDRRPLLAGGSAPVSYLPEGEVDPTPAHPASLRARLELLSPEEHYRAEPFLADTRGRPLPAGPGGAIVTRGNTAVPAARTSGVPWRTAPDGVRFTVRGPACYEERAPGAGRTPALLWGRAVGPLPAAGEIEIEVEVRHPDAGWATVGRGRVRVSEG